MAAEFLRQYGDLQISIRVAKLRITKRLSLFLVVEQYDLIERENCEDD